MFSFSDLPVPQSVVDSLRLMASNKSPFFQNGVILFEEVDFAGGNFVSRRFSLEDAEHGVVITGTPLTPGQIGYTKDLAPVLRRARYRRVVDGEFEAQALATSPSAALLDSAASWWAQEWDLALVATLSAAFGAGGPLESTHLHDITPDGGAPVKLSFGSIVDAGGLVGDAANNLILLVAHSRVVNDLLKEAGSRPMAVPVGAAPYAVDLFAGRARVIVSDGVEVSGALDNSATVFTSYLLSPGCLWTSIQKPFAEHPAIVPSVPALDITQSEHRVIGIGGLSSAAGMPANPTNAQLSNPAAWGLTVDPATTASKKSIGVVAIRSNATTP